MCNVPVLVTAPAEMPVSLAEAKAHLRVDGAGEDGLIGALILAATQHLDGWSGVLGRCLVTQEWRIVLPRFPVFPRDEMRLPLAPVQSATISYFNGENISTTLASGFDLAGERLMLSYGSTWPNTTWRADAVAVNFVAGYGEPEAVPAPIKQAILLMVGHWFQNREAAADKPVSALPMAVDSLISPYRRSMI